MSISSSSLCYGPCEKIFQIEIRGKHMEVVHYVLTACVRACHLCISGFDFLSCVWVFAGEGGFVCVCVCVCLCVHSDCVCLFFSTAT